ncbi:MAG TPA: guanylate kinase [Candidatus Scatomorpha intestinigallinarum]|jgi:guanylate kinase|uniref:Guanylate kinase n=1 Tax=Candidatus Scatomorpha intestinigallinarum TaxID=2840923 RepID=A0A9D1J0H4_9FIRM|nr:guanylate kinase [Candidatus Scatomorpha intestinigallinarum]
MNNAEKGKLLVISGPSGAGKSTVIGKLMELREDVCFSVSVTTRPARPNEEDGKDYFFVTPQRFQELAEGGFLLEHAEYVGNRYGTPRGYVESRLLEGKSVVLDIEVQGAAQVQRNCPDAVTVFILPPSGEELERRLRHRNTDTDEKIRERLLQAKRECAEAGRYGYIVVNDDPDKAARELDAIITAEKCKMADRIKLVTEVLIS